MRNIPEKDWQQLRTLKDDMLDNACERIFKKIDKISKSRKGREHESYLKLWKILKEEDEAISIMFDDLKRSNAFMKLIALRRNNLLSDNDLELFTEETQSIIKELA